LNNNYELDPNLLQVLLNYERSALVGRLMRGLVHNISGAVQMARLPMDLLELQLQRGVDSNTMATMGSIQEGMGRLAKELERMSLKSAHCIDLEVRQLDIGSLIYEQLDFWNADLFFKHDVKSKVEVEAGLPKVEGTYADLALAFNAMVENRLWGMRDSQNPQLAVKAWLDGGMVCIASQGYADGAVKEPPESSLLDEAGEYDQNELKLVLAQKAVEPFGGSLKRHAGPDGGMLLRLPGTA
jgi:two-component system NtrC family sensor kinase